MRTSTSADRFAPRRSAVIIAIGVALCGLDYSTVHGLDANATPPDSQLAVRALIGVLAAVGIFVGIRRHRDRRVIPWALLLLGALGISVAPLRGLLDGPLDEPLFDTWGFVLQFIGFGGGLLALSARHVVDDRTTRLDMAQVLIAGATMWIVVILLPGFLGDDPGWIGCGLIEPAMLTLIWLGIARFSFTGGSNGTAYRLVLGGAIAFGLTQPVAWYLAHEGSLLSMTLVDATPVVLAMWVAASWHPSSLAFDAVHAAERPAWGFWRTALLVGALSLPISYHLTERTSHALEAAVATGAMALMTGLIILRAKWTVDQLAETQRHLARQAVTDPLTGLLNRRGIESAARQHPAGSLAAIMVDLNRFKLINDVHGHGVGDDVLVVIAGRLVSLADRTTAIARLGGDEFGVLYRLDEADGEALCATISAMVNEPVIVNDVELHVSLSVGISSGSWSGGGDRAEHSADDAHLDRLLREADTALYVAKRARRHDPVRYTDSLGGTLERTSMVLDAVLGYAPGARRWLEYQLIVDFRAERPIAVGVEALFRCRSDALGAIDPAVAVAMAEEAGVMPDLGDWIFEQVVADIDACHAAGITAPPVSINVSTTQLAHGPLLTKLTERVREQPAITKRLRIEITESGFIDEARISDIDRIAALGFAIVVDDFGSKFASIQYLFVPGATTIKIDQSFVEGITHHHGRRSVVRHVVGMGDDLGLDVVAEGVESIAQLEILRTLGCGLGQGFLWDRPMPDLSAATERARQLSIAPLPAGSADAGAES